jgi:DNA-binding IscR family transcriptional regulator
MNTSFTVAAHILGYLAWRKSSGEDWTSSIELGKSINTHSVVVRRVLSKLHSHGLIETRRGPSGGSRLAKPAHAIHLEDVYGAVVPQDSSLIHFGDNEHSKCDIGIHIEAVLRDIVADSERVFRKRLRQTSIAEFSKRVVSRLGCCSPDTDE